MLVVLDHFRDGSRITLSGNHPVAPEIRAFGNYAGRMVSPSGRF